MSTTSQELEKISDEIVATYDKYGGINRIDGANLPTLQHIVEILDDFMQILFPGYFGNRMPARSNISFFVQSSIDSLFLRCTDEFCRACEFAKKKYKVTKTCKNCHEQSALELIRKIPDIRSALKMDIKAGLDGDPAAKSTEEVILCYPYVYAIATHRVAHEIYKMDIPLVPRMMSEWAHRRTGIDIHPGAEIGSHFFIDHGSGVVIGETSQIGNNVKIYQGVTLGALSFKKKPDGTIVKGGKRHPTIEDRATIYSGATILGGDTIIGHDSVIGANTWITASVPPKTLVTFQEQQKYRSLS
ncbi:MAG TPA: serine O-acetyltransferase [bacterium]|nr:serine O-acetyltransferase [bacterium]HPN44342.1 serine O-acetyltransferase [bacterium]